MPPRLRKPDRPDLTPREARDAALALLAARAPDATVCPSEVARALVAGVGQEGGDRDWRRAMPLVHDAVDALLAEGRIRLSWKGDALTVRAGPYRIGRRDGLPD